MWKSLTHVLFGTVYINEDLLLRYPPMLNDRIRIEIKINLPKM